MPDYVVLMKLTDQGARSIDEAPARIAKAKKAWHALGGKFDRLYVTFGEFDYVAVGSIDEDDEIADQKALVFATQLAREGNVRTVTIKAYPESTFEALLEIPPQFYRKKGPGSEA